MLCGLVLLLQGVLPGGVSAAPGGVPAAPGFVGTLVHWRFGSLLSFLNHTASSLFIFISELEVKLAQWVSGRSQRACV